MKEVQALQSMEVKLKDKYNRINEKYAVRTPRVRDYYAMRRISFQPTSGDELKILEELNRQVEADNQELMKQRLFEMMEEFHREQGEFIEERQEDMNRNHDLMIAKEYLFVDIHEQMKKMGVSDDATTRKLNRIEEILRNHQLYGEYGVKYRNDEEVGYERNYITDASLFLEAIGKHSLVGFRYAKESTYLTSPLSEWNEVAGMSYVEVKMWQVSYQQRLSEEMRSVVDDINEYFGEDFNRFMGEYSELFGEYMAGVSKADIPFWKKKLFLGEEMAFLSLSSIFDFAVGAFTAGTTLGITRMFSGMIDTLGTAIYYGDDMDMADIMTGMVTPVASFGIGLGFDEIRKALGGAMGIPGVAIGLAIAESTSKITTGYMVGFLAKGVVNGDWKLDGEAFARDITIGNVTAAAIVGMSRLEIGRKTGSSFLSSGATMAVRGGITAIGNTIYGEATGRRVSGFMETTGTSMADIGGLMGSGVKDAKRYDDSKKYRDEKYTVQEGMKMVMIDEERATLESMKSKANTEAELEMIKSQIKKLEEEQKAIVGEKEQRERRNVPIFPVALPIAAGRRSWRNRNENEENSGGDDDLVYEAIRGEGDGKDNSKTSDGGKIEITEKLLADLGIKPEVAKKYAGSLSKYMDESRISRNINDVRHFLAQVFYESANLTNMTENLNYTAEGLQKTFPKYYKDNPELAKVHAGNPELIANHVYGNNEDLGNKEIGDGYKYRGRGAIQLTGKANHERFNKYVMRTQGKSSADLSDVEFNILSSTWFWTEGRSYKNKSLSEYARDPRTTVKFMTLRVNGGVESSDARRDIYDKISEKLKPN